MVVAKCLFMLSFHLHYISNTNVEILLCFEAGYVEMYAYYSPFSELQAFPSSYVRHVSIQGRTDPVIKYNAVLILISLWVLLVSIVNVALKRLRGKFLLE